jgi:glycosyltransferase involved in cell wall biosynthesis
MIKKIKVLHTEWSDGWGGQEIRIINEMLAVREKGVEIFLACKDNSQIKQKALENNIPIFILPFRGNADFKTLFALKKIIKQNQIDIVNTHSGKDTWVGGLAAKMAGAKFIRTRHLSNRINPSRLNFINELADYIFTTGTSVASDMVKYNRIKPKNITSIPTGIDENIFNPEKYNKKECREKLEIKNDEIAIGIVAVLRSSKRHDNFLKIASKLNSDFPEKKFKFIIAGDGPKKQAIIKNIKDLNLNNVKMLGHIDNVVEVLAALDVFLFTADSREGVPQAVMQALCMEKNVIATNDGSTADLYQNNNFLLTNTDLTSIYQNTKKMIESLDNDKFLNKNREFIIENFSKEVLTDKVMHLYNDLICMK